MKFSRDRIVRISIVVAIKMMTMMIISIVMFKQAQKVARNIVDALITVEHRQQQALQHSDQ